MINRDPYDFPPGAPGYAYNTDDIQELKAAGISSYREVRWTNNRPVATKGGPIDFSLVQAGRWKPDYEPKLDPATISAAAGGIPKDISQSRISKLVADDTDPITHFKHAGGTRQVMSKAVGKRMGYEYGAGGQTWTWSQDPTVQASLALRSKDSDLKTNPKFAVGANGQRYFNMFGREDLAPVATRAFMKCDKPAKEYMIVYNDKENLPFCLREGPAHTRPVHNYWQSDDMWNVFRDEAWMKVLRDEAEKEMERDRLVSNMFSQIERGERSLSPEGEKANRSQPRIERDVAEKIARVNPEEGLENGRNERIKAEVVRSMTPKPEPRMPALSMLPQTISRRDATPPPHPAREARDATPRNTPRSLHRDIPTPRAAHREIATQVTPSAGEGASTPRSVTPRSTTPRKARGDATPRSMTPRSITSQGAPGLAMTPRLISRRGSTPGGASVRSMAKSASAVALTPRNS